MKGCGSIFDAAVSMSIATLVLFLPISETAADENVFLSSSRNQGGFSAVVSRILVKNRIRGCGEYSFRKAGPSEYHVTCWTASGEPTYYYVFTASQDVVGPFTR